VIILLDTASQTVRSGYPLSRMRVASGRESAASVSENPHPGEIDMSVSCLYGESRSVVTASDELCPGLVL
jgi:hypothetical protein